MIKDKINIEETVTFLNELLEIDPIAITALFSMRTACNQNLAKHDTVQVGVQGKYAQVGMFGIFNGLFGKDSYGWGHISADYDNGVIRRFRLLTDDDVRKYVLLQLRAKEKK